MSDRFENDCDTALRSAPEDSDLMLVERRYECVNKAVCRVKSGQRDLDILLGNSFEIVYRHVSEDESKLSSSTDLAGLSVPFGGRGVVRAKFGFRS